jgi:hypothetical protein
MLKHIKNVTQMFTRRFNRVAVIESNGSRGPLRSFTMVDLSRMAMEQLAESKAENVYIVACHFDFIQQKLRRTGECGYVPSIFIF